jgi:hypothetical protein
MFKACKAAVMHQNWPQNREPATGVVVVEQQQQQQQQQ